MRKSLGVLAALAMITAVVIPASGDGKKGEKKRDYSVERVAVKISVNGVETDEQGKALKAALKAKFKKRGTTGFGGGAVLLKVRYNVSVKLSEIQRVLTTVGRRYKLEFVADGGELKGKVKLTIKAGKKKPTEEQVAQLVAKIKALEGVVIQGSPKKTISPLTLMCADPGTSVAAINECVVTVFGLKEDAKPVTNVTWFGPKGRDPRAKPIKKGGGSRH